MNAKALNTGNYGESHFLARGLNHHMPIGPIAQLAPPLLLNLWRRLKIQTA